MTPEKFLDLLQMRLNVSTTFLTDFSALMDRLRLWAMSPSEQATFMLEFGRTASARFCEELNTGVVAEHEYEKSVHALVRDMLSQTREVQ